MSNIIDAIRAGNEQVVLTILESDPASADARDDNGISALLLALYHGKPAIAEAIAGRRSELDLFEATALGRADRVAELLGRDADAVHAFTPDGFPLIGYASFFGRVDLVKQLLEKGANPNARAENPMMVCPLHSAVANRDHEVAVAIARMLLDAGADPNAHQQKGYTALHSAAMHGNRELVDLLLHHGATRTIPTDDGRTAADFAREAGHRELSEYLQEAEP